ncbi:hypothetical protein BDW62DRAFT_178803, partial [Aspergillus aurantiobrunneus]
TRNRTSLQPLVYVPRVGPALRPKLIIADRDLSSYRLDVEDFEVEQQYLARVRDRSSREVP